MTTTIEPGVPQPLTWLPPEDQKWRDTVAGFAAQAVAPRVRAMDQAARIDPDLIRELFTARLMGVEIPEVYGGAGRDLFATVLTIEEIARVDPSVAVLVDVQNALVASALLHHGDGDARRRHLPRLANGTVGAYAISEPEAGSDAFASRTTAVVDGGGYVLDGAKRWISSAAEAGLFVVFARLADAGLTAFLVDRDTPGLTVGPPVAKMGIRASSTCDVTFSGVRVGRRDVLGRPGGGELLAVETLNVGKVGIAAQLVGLAQGVLDVATGYATHREQFGQPIAAFQGVAFPLARVAAELQAARALLYDTARLLQHGGTPAQRLRATAMAKYVASEVAERAAALAVETLGANGFVPEHGVEKFYRDAKVGKIYEGTSNMQFRTIAATHGRAAGPTEG
ncbi:butyryl-CoA dehydrogenase [Micromonospora viridifaciens]|uniref:short-chain 2-methylacyl-CoA dehydrogenase n=1 Tax=Micromonospora viridifaciens TaxID=1881 RepID=A0A1C4WUX5_MICVI|nr:acyl-CoA dehydrogenase family protein [Micromonospora viridifaciens]SCE99998.1 butyryl-CoA dehydrogenase [Micromonospora viridifaciens]